MKARRMPLLLTCSLIITLLVGACSDRTVSVAPSATPLSALSTTAATEAPASTLTPLPADTATPSATTAPASTLNPSPTDTLTPLSTATSAPTSTSPPEPAATEFHVPTDKSEVARISAADLKGRLDSGEAILVVDARSLENYQGQHIAGAVSVPLGEVESRLDEFPEDQEIVFYCT